jgi:hypothetical protein
LATANNLQAPNVALGTVSRPPQTANTPAAGGAPFVRMSRKAQAITFDQVGSPAAFGGNLLQTWKPVGGYMRRVRFETIVTAGSGANVGSLADNPYNIFSTLQFRDSQGALIINTDGYGLAMINAYGGQIGATGTGLPTNLPTYSAIVTTTGNFTLNWYMPFELNSQGYCAIPSLSAAAQPTLQIQIPAAATFYQTAPNTTVGTIELRAYTEYWTVPVTAPQAGPPGLGSTAQWQWGIGAQSVANSSNTFVTVPLVNTFIHTLICVLRDGAAGLVRQDNWPATDLTMKLDGVPIEYESFVSRRDKMHQQHSALATDIRPTGVNVYSWRDSVHQAVSQIDTGDYWLYTTPATLLEVGGTFGATGTSPDKIYFYAGQVWPQAVVPYGHLGS